MTDPTPTTGSAGLDLTRLALAGLVIIIGALLPIQAGMNSVIREQSGHPLYAGVLNFAVGFSIIIVILMVMRPAPVNWPAVQAAPWWAYLGGLIGASIVVTSAIAAPKLGAAFMVACLIAGQLIASVVIDQFGLARYPVRPISWERVIGVALLIAGLVLVERSTRYGQPVPPSIQ